MIKSLKKPYYVETKPRIIKVYGLCGYVYKCFCKNYEGIGDTPLNSYREWLKEYNFWEKIG